MKRILLFTFIFLIAFSGLAFAQNSKKAKPKSQYISKNEAELLAKEALSSLKGYSLHELKEIKKKKASSYEAVLSDSVNGTNLSFFITNKGVLTGPALNGELMAAPVRKKGNEKVKSAEMAEMAVKEYLTNYKGFLIEGVSLIPKGANDTEKAKKFSVMVKDRHENVYYVRVTPSGVRPQGLVSEAQMVRNELAAKKAEEEKEAEKSNEKNAEEKKVERKADNKEKKIINKDKKIYKDKQKNNKSNNSNKSK